MSARQPVAGSPAFARITTTTMVPEYQTEALELFRTSSAPLIVALHGCMALLGLIDSATGRYLAVTLWSSETDLLASAGNQSSVDDVAGYGRFVSGPMLRETYEVLRWHPPPVDSLPPAACARVSIVDVVAESHGRVAELAANAASTLDAAPGYRGFLVLANPGTGRVVTLSLWASRSALRATDNVFSTYEWLARSGGILRAPSANEVYRIHVFR